MILSVKFLLLFEHVSSLHARKGSTLSSVVSTPL